MLYFHGNLLCDNEIKLQDLGISNDDVLILSRTLVEGPMGLISMDVEAQKKIEEAIRLQNIQDNLSTAYKDHPESFAQVSMLYVVCMVNKVPVKVFVDCGAQATIITKKCAEKCGLDRLIDRRFTGTVAGVGAATIYGRIHSASLVFNPHLSISCSFTVLDHIEEPEFLLGLDMLKKYNMCIDLNKNVLRIMSHEVHFLPESEIPQKSVTHLGPKVAKVPNSLPSVILSEENIDTLMKIAGGAGVSRQAAIDALKTAGGNIDLAASILLGLI